jgi:hypothetical protein
MTNSAQSTEPDWTAIREGYENLDVPLKDLAAAHGMHWQTIVIHGRKAGWKPRSARTQKQREEAARDAGLQPSRLATRLKRLIAREIEAIEKENTEDRPATDRERDARRLASLVRSLERLNAIKAAKAKREDKGDDEGEGGDEMRAELERRLARLAAGDAKAGLPRQPDAERGAMAD